MFGFVDGEAQSITIQNVEAGEFDFWRSLVGFEGRVKQHYCIRVIFSDSIIASTKFKEDKIIEIIMSKSFIENFFSILYRFGIMTTNLVQTRF